MLAAIYVLFKAIKFLEKLQEKVETTTYKVNDFIDQLKESPVSKLLPVLPIVPIGVRLLKLISRRRH